MTVVLSCMDDKREILCNRRNSYSVLLCKTKRKNGWMNICATFGLIKFGLPVLLRLSTNTSLRSRLWHVLGTTGEPNARHRCVNFGWNRLLFIGLVASVHKHMGCGGIMVRWTYEKVIIVMLQTNIMCRIYKLLKSIEKQGCKPGVYVLSFDCL